MKNIFFCLSRRFEARRRRLAVKTRLKTKKITERKKKIFSGTKVQLYIDKVKKLLIYQCYFGETKQAKDFHNQALKESEREEY